MEPKHFLLDIDGCLRAGPINQLPGLEIIQHYVERAKREKLPLISLCTGRGRGYGEAMHQNIGAPDTFSIFENGCFMEKITCTPRELVEHPDVNKNRDLFAEIASFLADYAVEKGYYREPKEVMVTISVKGTNKKPDKLEEEIEKELTKKKWLKDVYTTHSETAVDITPKGVSKATGVLLFAKHEKLKVKDICGVGDSQADCGFLELVGFAGCPSNAKPEVKAVVRKKIKKFGHDHGFIAPSPGIFGVEEILEYFNKLKKVRLLDTLLPLLSDVQAIRDRTCFMVTRAMKILDKKHIIYEIEENPHVATTKDERRLLERPTDRTYWRWPAGGVLFVLKDRRKGYFCAVVLRDQDAPVDPCCFGTGAGVGAGEDEFLFPNRVAMREAVEEIIVCVGNKIACPFIVDDKWGGMNITIEEITRKNLFLASRLGRHYVNGIISLSAKLLDFKGDTKFVTKWGDKSMNIPGVSVEDKNNSAMDYLCAIVVDLGDHSINEVFLLDGEMEGTIPLRREMYLFKLEEAPASKGYKLGELKKVFKEGRPLEDIERKDLKACGGMDKVKLTPGLKKILESLRRL